MRKIPNAVNTREQGKEGRERDVERLHAKFHLNVFIVSASNGQKPQFWANFDIFGAPVPTPFTNDGEIW